MRGDLVTRFDEVIVDDLGGDVRGEHQAGEGSVFTTATATGIRVGVAITTAFRTGPREAGAVAALRTRKLTGTGRGKRDMLRGFRDDDINAGLESDRRPPPSAGG